MSLTDVLHTCLLSVCAHRYELTFPDFKELLSEAGEDWGRLFGQLDTNGDGAMPMACPVIGLRRRRV